MNNMRIIKKLHLALSIVAIISMVSPASLNYSVQAQEAESDTNQEIVAVQDTINGDTASSQTAVSKVTICHATSSTGTPYVRTVVDANATGGHFDNSGTPLSGHEDDLLFTGEVDCPQPQLYTVDGLKWNDANGNALRDTSEVGIADVIITLNSVVAESNGANDSLNLYHATTTTDTYGHYRFNEIPNGSYQICEVVPAGWMQTYPLNDTNNCHQVSTLSLDRQTGYSFGNQQVPFCGDKIKDSNEQCDDGNAINYDGCNTSCQLEQEVMCRLDQSQGWWGEYFDLSPSHPDVNIPGYDFPVDAGTHGDPLGSVAPWTADWYSSSYFRFSRIDANLNFGDNFFPMDMLGDTTLYGHNFLFTAHWRAKVVAPTNANYSYALRSDDDTWVYVDGVRFDDLDGIHPVAISPLTTMPLTAGEHIVDIFYAERRTQHAYLVMNLDPRLTITPAPKDCTTEPCHSPLDYNNTAGVLGPDGQLGLSDAVEFTKRYEAALGKSTGDVGFDATVDIKIDGKINAADLFCAQPYYGNAGPYSCQLDCSNICVNPLDYDHNYVIGLSDGVSFTNYYTNKTTTTTNDGTTTTTRYLADLNGNKQVDYGDYVCSHDQLAMSTYQCPIACAAVCGDAKIQARLGEKCDDGNATNGDGCSSSCQIETNQCEVPNPLDYNADFKLGIADAVIFTGYYSSDNILADVNKNTVVDYGDYLCAQPYYSGQLAYSCSLACAAYTPVCGDTHKDVGEQCDDGNVANRDGCNSTCQIETNQCEVPNPLDYNGDFKFSIADAVIFTGYYNTNNILADANKNAVVDYGDYLCAQPYYAGVAYSCTLSCAAYTPICGDTHKDAGEQCDDGNTTNGDGCSSTCQTEIPAPVCGNGRVESGEQCDDGNIVGGDNCDTICKINPGGSGGGGGGGGSGGGGGGGYIAPRFTLAVTKTVEPAIIQPGGQVTYTVTIKDTGNIIGSNIDLKDTMPAGFTFADGSGSTKIWHWDTISPNQTLTVSYLVNVSPNAVIGVYQNLAVVTSAQNVSAQASASVSVEKPQVLGVDNTPPKVIPPTIPKKPEPVKVLGFEKLPDTSGTPDLGLIVIISASLVSLAFLLRYGFRRQA